MSFHSSRNSAEHSSATPFQKGKLPHLSFWNMVNYIISR